MDFAHVPINDIFLLYERYNREILNITFQADNNAKENLIKHLSKIVRHDLSLVSIQNFPKCLCMKVTDIFLTKKYGFELIINEISFNQLEFKLKIKQSIYEEFFDSIQDLTSYLKREVLDKILFESDILKIY